MDTKEQQTQQQQQIDSNTNSNVSHDLQSKEKNGSITFVRPTKRITSPEHLKAFLASDTCKVFLDFIQGLSKSVERKSNSYPCNVTPVMCSTIFISTKKSQNRLKK
jgi:hypothetical protein